LEVDDSAETALPGVGTGRFLRAPTGTRTQTEAILSRLPLPLGYGGVPLQPILARQRPEVVWWGSARPHSAAAVLSRSHLGRSRAMVAPPDRGHRAPRRPGGGDRPRRAAPQRHGPARPRR